MTDDITGRGDAGGDDRLERLYEEALALPEEERDAFLDRACAADPRLRAELASLLVEGAGAHTFIDDLGRFVAPAGDGAPDRLVKALADRYTIEDRVGRGGMATVYRARDLRHERKVALKVLKPELAAVVGGERFLAEIKTTANLQHPHILPLFDSGEADGFLFYVMPYVEGESLRHRLDREHQLPVDEAVRLATDVAEALDYAHRNGVIHRDIKPANILLQDGEPVVADFGIALALSAAGGGRLTETGLSLGTPHYMSPEQATGDHNIGASTDIYALGCVLYEMLAGEPPYTGSTPQAILGRIIAGELAPTTKHRATVPPNVDAAIRKALEKVPADRFVRAKDLAVALADRGFRHAVLAADRHEQSAGPWRRLTIVSSGLAVLASVLAFWVWSVGRPEPPRLARFQVTLGEELAVPGAEAAFDVSADGRIVFIGMAANGRQLWQKALDDLDPVAVPGTEGAGSLVLSPDGRSVAFEADGGIKTVGLAGGPPFTVVSPGFSPAWGSDGTLYFSRGGRIHRVPATGGQPEPVTSPSGRGQWYSQALPDGRGLLLTLWTGRPQESRIAVVGPEGGEVREILIGTVARYAASGHVVYGTAEGRLMAAPFDVKRLEVTGPSVALVEGIRVTDAGASQFTLSETGTLLYESATTGTWELVWVDRSGEAESIDPAWTGDFFSPALSPDGTRVALSVQDTDGRHIWVKELDGGPPFKLTFEGRNFIPTWTSDGVSVTFASDRGENSDLWSRPADMSGPPKLELDEERSLVEARWSAGDRWLVFRTSFTEPGVADILAVRRGLDTATVELAATEVSEHSPALSPNGRWMAYLSFPNDRGEVHVVPFPNAQDGNWRVAEGVDPMWSPTGSELFYRNLRDEMVAVEVQTEPTFSWGPPRVLFSTVGYRNVAGHSQYDVGRDGQRLRFLMLRQVRPDEAGQLILVQNFFEELKARVPN